MEFITKDSGERARFETGAQRDNAAGKGRYDLLPVNAIRRIAQLYERGAVKYDARNWEKGIPVWRMYDSALRHLFQALGGERDEDHLAAAVFNVLGIMEYEERILRGMLEYRALFQDLGPLWGHLQDSGTEPAAGPAKVPFRFARPGEEEQSARLG